jgi:predicted lipoprotein with Yx(FWY)xxD motif
MWIALIQLIIAAAPALAEPADPGAESGPGGQDAAPGMPGGIGLQKTIQGIAFADFAGSLLYIRSDGSPCAGRCREDWLPLAAPAIARGSADWSVVTRADGSKQWAYRGSPLYTQAKNAETDPESGDARSPWRLVVQKQFDVPPGVAVQMIADEPAFVTPGGMTIYEVKRSAQIVKASRSVVTAASASDFSFVCDAAPEDCAKWQPLKAESAAFPPDGWTIVTGGDGARQWAYRGKPLYVYAEDGKPGDAFGLWEAAGRAGDGLRWQVARP